jgi:hypothetical protein
VNAYPVDLEVQDTVNYYVLSSSVPYNVPDRGSYMHTVLEGGMVALHAGIGVHVVNTGKKFTIELVQPDGDYSSMIFPNLTSLAADCSNAQKLWANVGEVTVTYPLDPSLWMEARKFASSNGQGYYQLIKWLKPDGEDKPTLLLQPVNVVPTNMAPGAPDGPGSLAGSTVVTDVGKLYVEASDSYAFTKAVEDQCALLGMAVDVFMPRFRNAIFYPTGEAAFETDIKLTEVSLLPQTVPELDHDRTAAINWFNNVRTCAKGEIPFSVGPLDFVSKIRNCMVNKSPNYVYVFKDYTSVWKVVKHDIHLDDGYNVEAPVLSRVADNSKPPPAATNAVVFTSTDVVLYSSSLALVLVYVFVGMYFRFSKKTRRRVSIAAEAIAKAAAAAIHESENGSTELDDKEAKATIARYFYEERKEGAWTLGKWWKRLRGLEGEESEGKQEARKERKQARQRAVSNMLQTPSRPRTPSTASVSTTSRVSEDGQSSLAERTLSSSGAGLEPPATPHRPDAIPASTDVTMSPVHEQAALEESPVHVPSSFGEGQKKQKKKQKK